MKLPSGAIAICVMALGMTLAMTMGAGAAMNQAPEPSPPAYSHNSGNANPKTVDDATLKRTAVAYVKVQNITLKTRQVLKHTNDAAKKGQIIRQAESKEIEAVRQVGMQPQQYNQVILLVQNNDQLQRKFLSYVHQAKGGANGGM